MIAARASPRRSTCSRRWTSTWTTCGRRGARIPDGYDEVQKEAEAVRAALSARPAALRPCHCDPLAENFLDTGARIFIIDWEYAGNNDPMWDLGDVSVEAGFDADQDAALLQAYFAGNPPAGAGRPHGHVQGDVRPAVDVVGRDPGRRTRTRSTTSGPMPSIASSAARP